MCCSVWLRCIFCRVRGWRLLLVYEGQQEECYVMWAPVARVWGHRWPIATLHQTLSELKVDASLQLHCETQIETLWHPPTDVRLSLQLFSDGQVKWTNVMCQQWVRWAESCWRGRTLTGFLSASAPLPQRLHHPQVLRTPRAGCWSGRNVRRGCLRCPCQCSPLLHWVWKGEREIHMLSRMWFRTGKEQM